MITEYIDSVLKNAKYELLEDWTYYWEIDWFEWVWANANSLANCQNELKETLEEWIVIKIRKSGFIPTLENYDLNKVLCEI